jgi:hypothetical protein
MTMLRTLVFLSFIFVSGFAVNAGTANEKEARAIVDKAFHAMGSKEKLAAIRAATWKARGKFYGFGAGVDFQGNYAVQGVDKGRTELTYELHFKSNPRRPNCSFSTGPTVS